MSWRKLSFIVCIIYSFLFFSFVGVTQGRHHQQLCNSSCGGISIQYPFRLKGDATNCGDPKYELTCSGNKTLLEFQSVQFLVQEINYSNHFIKIVEVGLQRSNCSLPLKSLTPTSTRSSLYRNLEDLPWISFMNCSKKLTASNYQLIACLSTKDSYVYGVAGGKVSDLKSSCSFLTMIPTYYHSSNHSDLFQVIQDGFYFHWAPDGFSFIWLIIYSCIAAAQYVIGYLLIERLVFAPLILFIFLAHKFWTTSLLEDVVEKFLQSQQSFFPVRYTYSHIVTITGQFKEQLGRGGFGSVYKGELPGGNFIAVKLLAGNSKCSGDDFISEVSTIGRIHHLNVVRLIGFCSESSKRALIYEFMPNKSLDKYIFSSNRCFTWQKLNDIALGIARGIDYLHRGCDMTILHFDIKPQNILLDQSFVPKISDFGLAKLYPKEYNAVSISAARGTIGYIAPELVSRNFGVISHKSDVYSFGMLLMEMAAGRKNVDTNAGSSSQNYYPSLIYDRLNNDVKEGIEIQSFEMNEVEKKMCLVGLWCIQIRPIDRPSMSQVVQMLQGEVEDLEFPPKPFFSCSSSIPRTLHSNSIATIELEIIDEDDST